MAVFTVVSQDRAESGFEIVSSASAVKMRLGEKDPVVVDGKAGQSSTAIDDLQNVPQVRSHLAVFTC